MHRRRRGSAILALGLVASLLVPLTATAPPAVAAPSGSKKVIVQLFEWNWPSVASECQSTLGPKGYGYVQVSPPQEHVRGNQWWLAYQPVSYRIESRKGTRAQFQSMVNTCHAAGVKVIVDAVINHMSGQDNGGTGWAGSSYSHYDYPGIYQTQDFHHCGRNGGDDIANYNDRYEVQNCELVNLVGPEDRVGLRPHRRSPSYLNDLLSLGVDGFRLDASKHMPAADIAAIRGKLSRSAYIVQEVIYGAGEPVQPTEYTGNGDVHEFRYGKDLARVFRSRAAGVPAQLRRGLGLPAQRVRLGVRGQPRHPARQQRGADLQGSGHLRPGERLHAGLAVRLADGHVQLHLQQPGRRPALGRREQDAEHAPATPAGSASSAGR